MVKRNGIAVPMVLTLGGILALMVFGVINYSGQELKWVARLIDSKQAEYLAYAGINYAKERLSKEGRWYQPPDGTPIDRYLSLASTEEQPFGAGNGKFFLVFLETTRTIKCKDHPLYEKYTSPAAPNGYINLNVVSSINVYSLGVKGDDRVMMFARFIMSPEPIARSRSTDAPGTGKTTGAFAPNEITITVAPDVSQATPDGKVETIFKVDSILAPLGKQVQGNERIVQLSATTVVTTKQYFPCAEVNGKVKSWLVTPGSIVKVGQPIAIIESEAGTAVPSVTLKKMVQVTKIDLRKFSKNIKGMDPETIKEVGFLKSIWESVDNNYKEAFTRNFIDIYQKQGDYQTQFQALDQNNNLTISEVEKISGATVTGAKESEFIMTMFRAFFPPNQGIDPDSEDAKKFSESARFNLSHRPRSLKAETEEACSIFAGEGGSDFKAGLEATVPKQDPGVCLVDTTEGFISKLKSLSTQGFSEQAEPDKLIERLTFLQKATSKGTIDWVNGTPWETKALAIANESNGGSYKEVPSKKGWYPPPNFSAVSYGDAYYTYENGSLKLRVDYILNFFRKHYCDDGRFPTGKNLQLGADQEDSPQAPGPPDVTGRRTSDGC